MGDSDMTEGCQSGRLGRSRKPVSPQGFREFESRPLRQAKYSLHFFLLLPEKNSRRTGKFLLGSAREVSGRCGGGFSKAKSLPASGGLAFLNKIKKLFIIIHQ